MADDPPAGGPGGADDEREDREEPRESDDSEPAAEERADSGVPGADEATQDTDDQQSSEVDGESEADDEEEIPDEEASSGGYVDLPAAAGRDEDAEASDEEQDDAAEADEEGDNAAEADEGKEDEKDEESGDDAADETGDEGDEDAEEADEDVDDSDEEAPDDAEETDEDADEDAEETDEEAETGTSVEMHDDTTPIQRKTGPASDKEQPLADHIEEMVKRLAIVVVVAGVVSLLAFPFGEDFILFLWYSVLPADISQPHVYHPLELVITQLKAASLLGLVLALPVFVYETYAFMRPGLYPHERRYYLAAVPTSLILAFVGLLFGYFIVLPAVMNYFLYYSDTVVDIAFALGQTFSLMLILLGYLAIVFQIPLFVMLAIMMGLTTRVWLEERRLIFWGAFLGISFLFSPDPTGMAPIVIAATMVALFEGTLLLLRWTGRG